MRRTTAHWMMLGLALALLAALLGIDLYSAHERIATQERVQLIHQADIVEANLSGRLQTTSNAIDSLRNDLPELRALPSGMEAVSRHLRTMVTGMTGVRTLLVINADGRAVASNRKELLGMDFRSGERYQAISKSRDSELLFLSPPFVTPLGAYAMSASKLLLDAQGEFAGYILAILDPEYFRVLLDSVRYAPDMHSGLVHGEGLVVFRVPDAEHAMGKNLRATDSLFSRHMHSGERTSVLEGITATDGENSLIVYRSFGPEKSRADHVLSTFVSRSADAMFAPWRRMLAERLGGFLAIVLVAVIVLSMYQRRLRAIEQLRALRTAEQQETAEALALLNVQLEKRAIDAEVATRAKDALMRNMSHELRTPLNHITGGANILLREALSPKQEKWLRTMREAAGDLLKIISGILDVASIESGELNLEPRNFSLHTILDGLVETARPRAEKKGLALVLEKGDGLPDQLHGDPVRLAQALLSYLDNAIKFSTTGVITLAVRVQNQLPDAWVLRFDVRDSGIGMDAQMQARIFAPFVQGDDTAMRAHGGLGLGLFTTRELARLMGGETGVESEPGRGSTFWLSARFPRTAPQPA